MCLADSPRVELIEDSEPFFAPLREHFGLPQGCFEAYALVAPNAKLYYLVSRDHDAVQRPEPAAVGLPFLHVRSAAPKLTTAAVMLLGHLATRQVVTLDRRGADRFIQRKFQGVEAGALVDCEPRGYVIARHEGLALGLGFLRTDDNGGVELESYFPKAFALREHLSAFEGSA